jgi:hypothetical protein
MSDADRVSGCSEGNNIMLYTCIENIEVNEEVDGCLNAWVRSLTGSLTTTLHGVHPL